MDLQDAANVKPFVVRKVSDHNNEQLNLREVGKLLRGKENKGELFSVEAGKNKANLSIFKWTVNWVAKYFDTSKSPKFPHF